MMATRTHAELRPIVFASPGLEPSAVQVAQSLVAAGLLQKWVVPLAVRNGREMGLLARGAFSAFPRMRALLSARMVPEPISRYVQCYPVYEFVRIALSRAHLDPVAAHRFWYCAEINFDRYVADNWAGWTPVFYGCENSAVISFHRHRAAGGKNMLWQVIAHRHTIHRLLEEEFGRFPSLRNSYYELYKRSKRTNERKEEQIQAADFILANSDFVRRTFVDAGVAPERVVAVPTACPPALAEPRQRPNPPRPFIFLNAGTLSIRKGIHLLLQAWRRLNPGPTAQLWLVGTPELPEAVLRDLPGNVVLRPRVPRSEMPALFRQVDAFVLPTLCEGRANVVLQALGNGVPVITTPNSGCEDMVREGETGWLVPAQDIEALCEKMQACLDHAEWLPQMGAAALERVRGWQLGDFARVHNKAVLGFLARHGLANGRAAAAATS